MNEQFWQKNAASWSQAVQSRLIESRKTTGPALVDEILRLRPREVLDLGCGEGWVAPALLAEGISYQGLDAAAALIEIARNVSPKGSFEVLSYAQLIRGEWDDSRKWDLVIFNFSLFDEEIRPLLRKAASFLHPRGSLLIQTLHPCFSGGAYQDGWRVEDFASFPVPFEETMSWYGRTLGSWLRVFTESGLRVRDIVEPVSPSTGSPLSIIFSLERSS